MKRRNFLRTCVVASLAGLLPATKGKNTLVIEPKTGVKKEEVARRGLSAKDIYDMALEEINKPNLSDPTRIWAEEMARLHNEAMDEMIIDCFV